MRIFLTGATGYIGSAVTDALLRSGHEVTALVREPEKAEQISGRGVTPIVGELSRPTSYAAAAETADSIIHTALEGSPRKEKVDRQAIDTLIAAAARRAAAGLPACVVYTSGTWVLGETHEATEEAALNPIPLVSWRPEHEQVVLQADRQGVRPVVIRPGVVYGGARGIVGDLLKDAANGLVRVVGTSAPGRGLSVRPLCGTAGRDHRQPGQGLGHRRVVGWRDAERRRRRPPPSMVGKIPTHVSQPGDGAASDPYEHAPRHSGCASRGDGAHPDLAPLR